MVEPPPTPEPATGAAQEPAPVVEDGRCPLCRRAAALLGPVTLLAVLLHPTQITLRQWAELIARPSNALTALAQRIPAVGITLSDALLVAAFALWLVHIWQRKRVKASVRAFPPALVGLFAAGVLSALVFLKCSYEFTSAEVSLSSAAKELIQLGIFFVCGFTVLTEMLGDAVWRRRLLLGFGIAAALAIVFGLAEYAQLTPGRTDGIISPTEIDGSFGLRAGQVPDDKGRIATASNRNVLGAWISVALPLLWGAALWARRRRVQLACGALVLGGMPLLLTGGLWLVTLVVLLGIAFLRGRTAFLATAVGLVLFWGAVFAWGPQQHGHVLLDSSMLCRQYDRFYTLRLYNDDASRSAGADKIAPHSLKTFDYEAHWQQKFSEWQPGLQALAHQPLFGVGLGAYQTNINFEPPPDGINPNWCYSISKQPGVNLMEFGANSGWLVWGVTTGLIGIIAMLWLLLWAARSAATTALRIADGPDRGLAIGALGAVCAVAGGMLFTEYLVRGVGPAVVFAFALAYARPPEQPADAPPPRTRDI
jgi:hypothetical protein